MVFYEMSGTSKFFFLNIRGIDKILKYHRTSTSLMSAFNSQLTNVGNYYSKVKRGFNGASLTEFTYLLRYVEIH